MKKVLTLLFLTIFVFTLSACGTGKYNDYPDAIHTETKNGVTAFIFNNDGEYLFSEKDDTYWWTLYDMSDKVKETFDAEIENYGFAKVTANILHESGGIDGRNNITIKRVKDVEPLTLKEMKTGKGKATHLNFNLNLEHPFFPALAFYGDTYVITRQGERFAIIQNNVLLESFDTLEEVAEYFKDMEN